MKIKIITILTLSIVGCNPSAFASYFPMEFVDFFEQHEDRIEVVIEGSQQSSYIVANVSYDFFQLTNNKESNKVIFDFLVGEKLKEKYIENIIDKLNKGVKANPNCQSVLSSCIPEDIPGEVEFVFDYDTKLLRIFVSTDMFIPFTGEVEYYNPVNSRVSLINWSNLYTYVNQNNQSLNWNNESLLGLPNGYVSFDSKLQSMDSKSSFDIDRLLYNYESEGSRTVLGYKNDRNINLNSTDFLISGANYSGVSAIIGSSYNLIKNEYSSLQRLYFFSPQGGQLEVYNNDRLIVTKVVDSGENSIGYDELPIGTYTVTLRLKQGSNIILEEKRSVVNNSSFALPLSGWDYRLEVGQLENKNRNIYGYYKYNDYSNDRNYISTLVTHRATESWLIGSGFTTNGDNIETILGSRLSFDENINIQYSLGLFSNGDEYQFAQLNITPMSFNFREMKHDDLNNIDVLSHNLYGLNNFKEYGAGLSGRFFNGHAYINYFRYEYEGNNFKSLNDNVSITWSRPLFGGDISVSASYNKNQFDQESYNTGISWNFHWGDNVSSRIGMSIMDNKKTYSYTDVSYLTNNDGWSSTSQIGIKRYGESNTTTEAALSLQGNTDIAKYDTYSYINSEGERSISANISGTQMFSSDGVSGTFQKGQAFIELTPKLMSTESSEIESVDYIALKNGKYWYSDAVDINEKKMVSIPAYSLINFKLDDESINVNALDNDEYFVMPGNYYHLNSEIIPLKSQIFILNDINGDPINTARCIGNGCRNIEVLSTDGVFRINYYQDKAFKIISDKRECVYDSDLIGSRYIYAYCLPGLNNDGLLIYKHESLDVKKIDHNNDLLIYIGKYEVTTEAEKIIEKLNQAGLDSKSINIGKVSYVYVPYKTTYSIEQRSLLDNLDAYVITDEVDIDKIFAVRLIK
ncbi:TcfC E-set like domain-containing protein [Vibrio sp. E150_018]